MNHDLVIALEDVRSHFGKPVVINSGLRCQKHNTRVGGAKSSQHLLGTAADIRIAGVSQNDVYAYLNAKYTDKYGVGKYRIFTHIDVRENKARWKSAGVI